jgi:alcohol dehydrogenase, propanol-preferring
VLLKVVGAGACHSDVAIFHEFDADPNNGLMTPPFVLGHETAGWIEAPGPGVRGLEVGAPYLVYGPIGCGHCKACSRGQDTYCENPGEVGYLATGLGRNGGMAEYMTVPGAQPRSAGRRRSRGGCAPGRRWADAGPRHQDGPSPLGGWWEARARHRSRRPRPGCRAVLRAITGAQVIATDLKPQAMTRASDFGAVTVEGGPDQAERIRALTGGRGVDAAFDFVGAGPTIALTQATIAQRGAMQIVGVAGGAAQWSFFANPYEATLTNSYWGTIEDLHEVVELYRSGLITPDVERFMMDEALEAYRRLRDGELDARAVVVPHS